MKFSAKFEYAVLAILYLKCEPDEAPVSGRVLAQELKLPYKFLEQILNELKKAGLIRSIRGYKGGYQLNQAIESISLYDVANVTEGKIEPWNCDSGTAGAGCAINHDRCVVNHFYMDLKMTLTSFLKSYTLDRMCMQRAQIINPQAKVFTQGA